jgi:hypothetical protein
MKAAPKNGFPKGTQTKNAHCLADRLAGSPDLIDATPIFPQTETVPKGSRPYGE